MSTTDQFWQYAKEAMLSACDAKTDDIECYGGRDRDRRCVLQGPRLRRLVGPRTQTDLDRRSHHPRQDIKARQSLSARSVRASRVGRADQAEELGAPWTQALDRGSQEATAPQRACESRSPTSWPASPGACWLTAVFLKRGFKPR